jgi:hypothetical protein
MEMAKVSVSGLEDLEKHLQQLIQDPATKLDGKLFDDVELQLTGRCFVELNVPAELE